MSNCYLGNRGREIPKSKIFGRSQNELEFYKSQKAYAVKNLNLLREEIDEIKDDRSKLFEKISEAKQARQAMFELREGGATASALKLAISEASSSLSTRESRLEVMDDERVAFLRRLRIDLGIPEREQEVERIKTARQNFIMSFETSAAVAQRKERHRREWRARNSASKAR